VVYRNRPGPEFVLQMDLGHPVDLEDFRIDIIRLLQVTWAVDATSTITISIVGTEDDICSKTTTSLAKCRAAALAALPHSCSRYLDRERWSAYPLVWINGRFEVVEVGPADDLQDFLQDFLSSFNMVGVYDDDGLYQ
jgi:hypothetical protein